jgi:hypothetical protein
MAGRKRPGAASDDVVRPVLRGAPGRCEANVDQNPTAARSPTTYAHTPQPPARSTTDSERPRCRVHREQRRGGDHESGTGCRGRCQYTPPPHHRGDGIMMTRMWREHCGSERVVRKSLGPGRNPRAPDDEIRELLTARRLGTSRTSPVTHWRSRRALDRHDAVAGIRAVEPRRRGRRWLRPPSLGYCADNDGPDGHAASRAQHDPQHRRSGCDQQDERPHVVSPRSRADSPPNPAAPSGPRAPVAGAIMVSETRYRTR